MLLRTGRAPKRLIPFCTDTPFSKRTLCYVAPNGMPQRVEFLGAEDVLMVWCLFGNNGICTMEIPVVHQRVGVDVRYHVRAGKHDVTAYDWEQYIKFAKEQWK